MDMQEYITDEEYLTNLCDDKINNSINDMASSVKKEDKNEITL